VVDPSKQCPGTQRCWSSKQPLDGNIKDFVNILMALPESDERTADVTQILTDHYNAALASAGSKTAALQSTFTLACASPLSESSGL